MKGIALFDCRVADHVTLEEAAVIEPLAIARRALERSGDVQGKKVLITGAGPIGLATVLVAQAMGAGTVAVTGESD